MPTKKKRQSWSQQEDQLLFELYQEVGCFQRWKFISKKLKEKGIQKSQFQCRQRFINKVDPNLKQGKISLPQITKLFKCYDEYGAKWSLFQTLIIGRSQSLLKNKFYSTLKSMVKHFIKTGERRLKKRFKIASSCISTKLLTEIYEGKRDFIDCKNILKNTLKHANYNIQGPDFKEYLFSLQVRTISTLLQSIARSVEKQEINNVEQQDMKQKEVIKCQDIVKLQGIKIENNEEKEQFPNYIQQRQIVLKRQQNFEQDNQIRPVFQQFFNPVSLQYPFPFCYCNIQQMRYNTNAFKKD